MPTIALVMIARDEARCIARALRSARAHVDEMHVLDTGSVDATCAIAAQCGAQVTRSTWRDDFAAARNEALALTQADWRLVLDADEWIDGDARGLNPLRTGCVAHLGLVCVASDTESRDAGRGTAPSWLPRLLPRGVGYTGRVHEQPLSDLPRRRYALTLRHDGYLPATMQRKRGRNRRLLELALSESPDDAYLHYQLGKDHEVHGDYAAAEPCFAHAAARADAAASWRHDLVLRRLFTLKKLGRHAQAFELARTELPHWPHSPDFFFTLGDVLLDWAAAQPALAVELLPLAESAWTEALAIGENPQLPDRVCGRGSWLAAHNLAVLHEGTGRSDSARAWRERAAVLRAAQPTA